MMPSWKDLLRQSQKTPQQQQQDDQRQIKEQVFKFYQATVVQSFKEIKEILEEDGLLDVDIEHSSVMDALLEEFVGSHAAGDAPFSLPTRFKVAELRISRSDNPLLTQLTFAISVEIPSQAVTPIKPYSELAYLTNNSAHPNSERTEFKAATSLADIQPDDISTLFAKRYLQLKPSLRGN